MSAEHTPKLVLFDCDGVIVDSERITNLCLQQNLSRHGLDLPLQEVMSLFVGGTMFAAGEVARRRGAVLPLHWLEAFYDELYEKLAKEVKVISGVTSVFDALDRASIPYAVCSNGRIRKMKVMLSKLDLWSRLGHNAYSAQDMGAPKPAPDVYLKAAADRGISPRHCVVVEDSVTGLRAAVAAQMRCFGYLQNTHSEKLAPYADVLFEDMSELPEILGI